MILFSSVFNLNWLTRQASRSLRPAEASLTGSQVAFLLGTCWNSHSHDERKVRDDLARAMVGFFVKEDHLVFAAHDKVVLDSFSCGCHCQLVICPWNSCGSGKELACDGPHVRGFGKCVCS